MPIRMKFQSKLNEHAVSFLSQIYASGDLKYHKIVTFSDIHNASFYARVCRSSCTRHGFFYQYKR